MISSWVFVLHFEYALIFSELGQTLRRAMTLNWVLPSTHPLNRDTALESAPARLGPVPGPVCWCVCRGIGESPVGDPPTPGWGLQFRPPGGPKARGPEDFWDTSWTCRWERCTWTCLPQSPTHLEGEGQHSFVWLTWNTHTGVICNALMSICSLIHFRGQELQFVC